MSTPHPHAALIRAWADGATIETLNGKNWEICHSPTWHKNSVYRIKPKNKKILLAWIDPKDGELLWRFPNYKMSENYVRVPSEDIIIKI